MPDAMIERAARHEIAEARRLTPETHPWAKLPDGYLAARYATELLQAAANMREYLIDVHGGIGGAAEWRALLHAYLDIVPETPFDDPCPCVRCDPDTTHLPSLLIAAECRLLADRRDGITPPAPLGVTAHDPHPTAS